MLYRETPRSKESLSILGFGCMRLPMKDGQADEAAASRMMHVAVEKGINYVDTAWPYHGGQGEAIVGRLLKGLRDKVYLATKLPSWLVKKREDMDDFLDKQLASLQTDHVDVYLLHALTAGRWENMTRLGALEFMEKARAAGKIRQIAFSFHDGLDTFKKIIDAYPWDLCQIQYNFMDENFQAGTTGLEYAAGKGVGVIVMEPLRGGNLAAPVPEDLKGPAALARYTSPTLADIGLRWVWNRPEASIVLSGMSSEEQMEQNIESASRGHAGSLSAEELALVKAAKDLFVSRMQVPCTSCAYCKPCPQDVDIPQCFTNLNNAAISGDWAAQKSNYNYILAPGREGQKASACVECGTCEPKCPQHIPIREKLKEVAAAFE
ncbi:MAG: aldo/keto reductase [Synergistaceae bacterium]|jgi:predicted aldo/keto reductase-like oxidoreductase|nr:aldo/keto reductase [Synergistaceae bacterium]